VFRATGVDTFLLTAGDALTEGYAIMGMSLAVDSVVKDRPGCADSVRDGGLGTYEGGDTLLTDACLDSGEGLGTPLNVFDFDKLLS
jgi:hypothetical protein